MKKNIYGLFLVFLLIGCSNEDTGVVNKKAEINNSPEFNSEA
ncbi:hypothetical protein [Xanthomonas graminis]|nr:hypothetical protein [Xanthomonas translucens]